MYKITFYDEDENETKIEMPFIPKAGEQIFYKDDDEYITFNVNQVIYSNLPDEDGNQEWHILIDVSVTVN